jgi:hypothetical protein
LRRRRRIFWIWTHRMKYKDEVGNDIDAWIWRYIPFEYWKLDFEYPEFMYLCHQVAAA